MTTSFNPGQRTKSVWCGDFVTDCEFISSLPKGGLLFWDHTCECFRRAHYEKVYGEMVLNGWTCADKPFSS